MQKTEYQHRIQQIVQRLNELHAEDTALVNQPIGQTLQIKSLADYEEQGKKRDAERQALRAELRKLSVESIDD